jgi:hypothetical protein
MVEWCRQRKTPDSSIRTLWQSYQQNNQVASRWNLRKERKFVLENYICHTCKWFLIGHKILHFGASGFTSPLKEGVLRILIVLKNILSRPGTNPRAMDPVASTITQTPPRWLVYFNLYIPREQARIKKRLDRMVASPPRI